MMISNKSKIILGVLMLLPMATFAAGGELDVLNAAVGTLSAQLKGPGKTLIYILEGVAGAYSYLQSRNWVHLAGIGVVFAFTSILFSVV